MMIMSVPNINDLTASNLTAYDLPAPDVAKTTEFALGSENLSKITKELLCRLMPYKTPFSIVRSELTNGNVVAIAVVSKFLVILILSQPYGIQLWKHSSC